MQHTTLPPSHTHYTQVYHTHTLALHTTAENGLHGPHLGGWPAGGNKTSDYGGRRDTSLISPVACPPQCGRSIHLWAYKTLESRGMTYGLELWQQNICPGLLAIPRPCKSIRRLQGHRYEARNLGTNVTPNWGSLYTSVTPYMKTHRSRANYP